MNKKLVVLIEAAVAREAEGADALTLSGGLDSSTVSCVAQKLGFDLATYTGWYDAPGFDEREYAQFAAGSEHHEIEIVPFDVERLFDSFAQAVRPPYQGMGAFGQYVVAEKMAEHGVKTVLSGEGSDELFGGYARLSFVAGKPAPDGYETYKLPEGYPLKLEDALDWEMGHLPELLACDTQILDAFGISGRTPFTDDDIVEYALALPALKRVGKVMLRDAVRGIVPDEIVDRTDKMGFPIPLVAWANGPLRDFVYDRIGYLPDLAKPWERGWWNEMIDLSKRQKQPENPPVYEWDNTLPVARQESFERDMASEYPRAA